MSFFILHPSSFILALALASLVGLVAYLARALNLSGAIAAAVMGTLIFGLGGLPAAVLLLAFFVSSSLLSRLFGRRKRSLNEKFSKGSRRDAWQVGANGGLATVFIVLHGVFPAQAWPWIGFAASLAAVNADTWATELGVLSTSEPRLISTGRRVERGASGGISLVGTLAALVGAALIAGLGVWLGPGMGQAALAGLAAVALAGLFGALFDSYLGATVQAIYYCPACAKETERYPLHTCGTPTALVRGWHWLDNDWVNMAASLSGAGLALVLFAAQPAWFAAYQPAVFSASGGSGMSFPLSSSSFEEGELIPARYTCDGENHSPALAWRDLPSGTRSLAVIAEDPDAPGGTYTHWVLYNLPPSLPGLPEGLAKTVALSGFGTQGENSFRHTGYDGPCPPAGPAHRYYFRVYALDSGPTLPAGMSAADLRKAIQGHVLAEAEWVGRYGR
jgi:Raf kinase inhibitor-like YbhB/YbcL family protein/uncharacterized protein (TIGR00297 family)